MRLATPFWYNFLWSCLTPIYRFRVKKRSGHLADYQAELVQRFGPFLAVKNQHSIWFHAVSVGETNAAQALIEHYLHSGQSVLVTNTTRTGQARANTLFAQKYPDLFQAVFLPIDRIHLIRQFIDAQQPRILLLMETELWPNLLQSIHDKKIPQLLLNARLSEKSANGYAKFKRLSEPMLQQLDFIAAQDQATLQRFTELGKHPAQMQVLGNVKFDMMAPTEMLIQADALKAAWHLAPRKIMVLASTHAPEEVEILAALKTALQNDPDVLCIVVPRHPERFEEVFVGIKVLGLTVHRRSQQQSISSDTQVYLADSMGELWLWYALAQVAYVGGSLNSPGGGHNILEPIAVQVPTILGKNYFNFQQIVDDFVEQHAVQVVDTAEQAAQLLLDILQQPERQQQMQQQAQVILERNQGAVARHLAVIDRFLQP